MASGDDSGVRPFDWLLALDDAPILDDTAVLRAAWALRRFAPGRPRRGTGWTFFASERQLADAARCSAPTVRRGTADLVAAGYLTRVSRGGGGKANVYALAIPDGTPLTGDRSPGDQLRSPVSEDASTDATELRSPVIADRRELRSNGARTALTGEHPLEYYTLESSSSSGHVTHDRARRRRRDDDERRDEPTTVGDLLEGWSR